MSIRFFAISLLLAPLAAQQTIVVQGGGNALQNAVAQANPGDILVVRAGTYGNTLVDKGITIRCDLGVVIQLVGRGSALGVAVPAGQLFRMRGGSLVGGGGLFPALATSGAGTAIFEEVGSGSFSIATGTQVAFHRCGFGELNVGLVGGAVSNVAFDDCTLNGRTQITNARVTMAGGSATGSGNPLFSFPAFLLVDGTLTIAGDPTTVIAGNSMGLAPAPAIETKGGTLILGPQVRLVSLAPAPITGPATVISRFLPSIRSQSAAAGRTFTATVHGEVGSSTHILASLPVGPVTLPFGQLWISTDSLVLDSGIVPASGTRSVSLPLPTTLPPDVPVILQSITTLTNSQLWIGPPTAVFLN